VVAGDPPASGRTPQRAVPQARRPRRGVGGPVTRQADRPAPLSVFNRRGVLTAGPKHRPTWPASWVRWPSLPAKANSMPNPSSATTAGCVPPSPDGGRITQGWSVDGVALSHNGGEHDSMTGAWASGISPPILSGDGGTITLIEGSTFCLSSTSADILPDRPQGLFVSDTRVILSRQRVRPDHSSQS
jgi:hypothetical protein